MRNDSVRLDREERTALFLTLTGVQIQKQLDSGNSVSSRKLFKVLANCAWDWSLLPGISGASLDVSGPGDLVWVPHRFGSLGLVQPAINYRNVKQEFGLFAHLSDLLNIGIYAKYDVRVTRDPKGRLLINFPPFISFAKLTHSRVSDIDRHLWPQVAEIYAGLDDNSVDTMASCRNATATVFSLWTQLAFWKADLLTACKLIQDIPDQKRGDADNQFLRDKLLGAEAAVSHFTRKTRYWEGRDIAISKVRQAAARTELGTFIPVIEHHQTIYGSDHLTRLLAVRNLLDAANSLVHGLFGQQGLLDGESNIGPLEDAVDLIRDRTGSAEWQFRDVARLFFDTETKPVAEYIEALVTAVIKVIESETGLRVDDLRGHYKTVMGTIHPLNGEYKQP